MSLVTKHITKHTLKSGKVIELPANLEVQRATNLPNDSHIKYWVADSKALADFFCDQGREIQILHSHFRNIGFGVSADDVCHDTNLRLINIDELRASFPTHLRNSALFSEVARKLGFDPELHLI